MVIRKSLVIGWTLLLGTLACHAQGFKFSNDDAAEKAQAEKAAQQIQSLLATPCRNLIKNHKILVLIGENQAGVMRATQSSYNPQVLAINARLQALGLKTFTQEQIRKQVAQAEIDAYFKNDPDAALAASKRLSAQYILQGIIHSEASYNRIVNVNEVNVQMDFTLTGANGKMISQTSATHSSYAGADTAGMALTLINERADEVVAKLYSDYCLRAAP